MEFLPEQVGQSSATVTVTVLPFFVLVITTCFPQSGDWLPALPYRCESVTGVSFIGVGLYETLTHGTNKIIIRVYLTTSTGDAILIEKGGPRKTQ
jgi:hypothetical protein